MRGLQQRARRDPHQPQPGEDVAGAGRGGLRNPHRGGERLGARQEPHAAALDLLQGRGSGQEARASSIRGRVGRKGIR